MRRSAFMLCAAATMHVVPWTNDPASAHHAVQAQFDQNKLATLTGVMTRVMWINPHVRWFMDIADEDGNVTSWNISGAAPGSFRKAGRDQRSRCVQDGRDLHGNHETSGGGCHVS